MDWLLGFERLIVALLGLAGVSLTTAQSPTPEAGQRQHESVQALRLELDHGGHGATVLVFATGSSPKPNRRTSPVRASRPLVAPSFD